MKTATLRLFLFTVLFVLTAAWTKEGQLMSIDTANQANFGSIIRL